MTARGRISALYRELADAFEELEMGERGEQSTEDGSSRRRRPRELVRPEGDNDEVASARARRMLRKNGLVVKG